MMCAVENNRILATLSLVWLAANKDWQAINQVKVEKEKKRPVFQAFYCGCLTLINLQSIKVVGPTVQSAGWGTDRQTNRQAELWEIYMDMVDMSGRIYQMSGRGLQLCIVHHLGSSC